MLQNHALSQGNNAGTDWLAMLDSQNIEFVALDRHGDSDLVALLQLRAEWVVDFEDEEAVLFVNVARRHTSASSIQ